MSIYDEPERRARAILSATSIAGNPAVAKMIDEFGAEDSVQALLSSDHDSCWARRLHALKSDELFEKAESFGIRFIIPGDDEWPQQLNDLALCGDVGGMGGVPIGLWARGIQSLHDWTYQSIAVVGARAASYYGEQVARHFAAELASTDPSFSVISGGAYGIDAAAHRGALSGNGRSVGVYAGGLDECYPRGNHELFERLISDHLVISEIAPGSRPTRQGFLARNRLIAALSMGTVVIEAALRSGAKNTANWAHELGREVMAVPGSIHSDVSKGTHQMIRDGQACLVATP